MGYNTDILSDTNISEHGKVTYFALSKYVGKDGTCWPSVTTLATDCSVSERTIQRAINELINAGWVVREMRNRETSRYILVNMIMVTDSHPMVTNSHRKSSKNGVKGDCQSRQGCLLVTQNLSNELLNNNNINTDEKMLLEYLPSIGGYLFDLEKDLGQVREWLSKYPIEHVMSELEKFNAWWRDRSDSFKGKKNFRSSITNWLKKSKVGSKASKPKTNWL